ncbi:MAG: hypothetical protein ACI8UP_005104 [Porticoccaceae bacterium]
MHNILLKIKAQLTAGIAALTFAFTATTQAEPVMNLITVNTQDAAGYVSWAKSSTPIIAKANGAMAMGLCSPVAGAEAMGDHFLWSFWDSQKSAWAADNTDPAVVAEIAKNKVVRTIREWDNWRIVRAAATTSEKGYFWNIIVKTNNVGSYLDALDNMLIALKDHGHDLSLQVFIADTGRRAGQVMVSLGSPDAAALGAAMDDRTQDWFSAVLKDLEGTREYQHGWAMQCETYYAAAAE